MDYDYVFDDSTTRVKRICVKREEEIGVALEQWLKDLSELKEPDDFDSSLVHSPIDGYLNRTLSFRCNKKMLNSKPFTQNRKSILIICCFESVQCRVKPRNDLFPF
jgi:hypothetical protein